MGALFRERVAVLMHQRPEFGLNAAVGAELGRIHRTALGRNLLPPNGTIVGLSFLLEGPNRVGQMLRRVVLVAGLHRKALLGFGGQTLLRVKAVGNALLLS